MMLLDLSELEKIFAMSPFWSMNRPNLACFRRADYFGDPTIPLDSAIRNWVQQTTGSRPRGRIALLTHLRYFGHSFNPVSFYYCYDADNSSVETIVAEITNTPWNERFPYILSPALDESIGSMHRYRFPKEFHVSPFFPMCIDYDWRFSEPGSAIYVHMRLDQRGQKQFDASLRLTREEITAKSLAKILWIYPFMTLKVLSGIYLQAARLKWKGITVYDHPDNKAS